MDQAIVAARLSDMMIASICVAVGSSASCAIPKTMLDDMASLHVAALSTHLILWGVVDTLWATLCKTVPELQEVWDWQQPPPRSMKRAG